MEILAIIPARGGSKGLPGKNIRMLAGHPLIAYSILAAQESTCISRVLVSTDDETIAGIAKKYGASAPFKRPAQLAQDQSTDLEVFEHALDWLHQQENYIPDYVVQLRPTSPVRPRGMIDACMHKIISNPGADSLRVITEAPITPFKMWVTNEERAVMHPLLTQEHFREPYNMPRQLLPKVYWQTGTLDIIKTTVITEDKLMSGRIILPYIIPGNLVADIDDISSFEKAASIIVQYDCIKFES